jgi:cytochrome bd-type quinol oxidase subunit 2
VSHFNLMVAYALLLAAFFAILWRREQREQVKLFLQIFLGLVVGAIGLAWLMYPFPSGPPAPLP